MVLEQLIIQAGSALVKESNRISDFDADGCRNLLFHLPNIHYQPSTLSLLRQSTILQF